MSKKIWLSSPHMSEEGYELEYVNNAFKTNWIAPLGPNVNDFELELASKVSVDYAVALTSGTSAIHMALKALDVKSGDIVIVQSLTFSATVNPVIYQGATPVFIDSDEKTWNMDPDQLDLALEKYPHAKAVLVVHLYGFSADLDKIMNICEKYGVPLIEDSAESLGSKYKGKYTGTFGDFGIFSFNGNKIITTSGGGMLVSKNKSAIDKVRFWATQSRDAARHYQHSELGFNYRMSNVLAGIGRGQLKVLDKRVLRKKEIYDYYKNKLDELKGISFMPVNEWDSPNFWLTTIQLSEKIRPLDVMLKLEEKNIESRPLWKPMHLQPFYEKYEFFGSGISEKLFNNGLCLPSDTKLSDSDLCLICNLIKELWMNV